VNQCQPRGNVDFVGVNLTIALIENVISTIKAYESVAHILMNEVSLPSKKL